MKKKKQLKSNNRLHTFFKVGSLALAIGLLPGCFLQQTRHVKGASASAHVHEYQARFTDMPFPFDAQVKNKNLVTDYGDKVQFFINFTTKMSVSDLQQLYHQEMEQLGWQQVANFQHDPQQIVFVFEKPTKISVITIQPHTQMCSIKYHITTR